VGESVETYPQNKSVARNIRLLEFAVVFIIVVMSLWLLTPGVSDAVKLGHETTLKHSASALRDSLRWLALQQQSGAGEPSPAARMITALQARQHELTRADCARFWTLLLGDAAPSASIAGSSSFHIVLHYDDERQLGCRYVYTLAGNMFIDYFPMMGVIIIDDRF